MTPEQVTALLQEAHDRAREVKPSPSMGEDTRLSDISRTLVSAARTNGLPEDRLAKLESAFMETLTHWPQSLVRDLYQRIFVQACCPQSTANASAA